MLDYYMQVAFAGLWAYVWHFGLAIGLAICFGAAAYFSPLGKKFFAVCCIICIGFVLGEMTGVKVENARCVAQGAALNTFTNKVVKGTTTPASRAAKDPFDSKDN
jgi:hypothetical protein